MAVDIETDGTNVETVNITCLSLGTVDEAVSFVPQGEQWELTKRVLADPAITKVFHNGWMFDVPVLRRLGAEVH